MQPYLMSRPEPWLFAVSHVCLKIHHIRGIPECCKDVRGIYRILEDFSICWATTKPNVKLWSH